MKLSFARSCADKVIELLTDSCHRIQVAGSIRRGRPEVGDVDLVAVPKTHDLCDLLGNKIATVNNAVREVENLASTREWKFLKRGPAYMVWESKGVQIDLWFATPETWGTVLMCRTGSKEHNIWLASRAKRLGGHWNPHHGMTIGDTSVSNTEGAIYELAQLGFIEPANREAGRLPA